MRLVGTLGFALLGCAPAATETVALAVRAGSCEPPDLSQIRMLSVEVYGFDDGGERCVLQQRCIWDVDIAADAADPATEIEALLNAQTQPLTDTRREGAAWIGISGRSTLDCFAPPDVLCAFADLSNAADGTLDISLSCGDCPGRVWPHCP